MWLEFVLFALLGAYWLYRWATQTFTTFEERGIPHKKPVPLVGNAMGFVKNQQSLHKIMLNLYEETKQHKIYGFYNFRNPFFIINDPELIKQMFVKDFETFANHQQVFNAEKDPLLSGMLTIMKDQRWKNMRNTISPVFTGLKMRAMFMLMNECFDESMNYLRTQPGADDSFDMEMKDCFSRLSNDLIATTAFGIKTNSFQDKENEFFSIGQSFSKTRAKQAAKFMLYSMAPKVYEWLGLRAFDEDKTDYFVNLVVDTMKYREEHQIVRPDMIQLLMEAQKEPTHNWSRGDIVAQCFIFFFAAFENNANLLCTTCYELAHNNHVQQELYEEIMETHRNLNGKPLDYDTLHNMKYLDMVLSESLRKWSLAALTDRVCGKDYTVKDERGNVVCELKKGDYVWYQQFGILRDPDFFPNPNTFEPKRFSEENKHKIKPYTYLPFGVGPRICIGNRYALMQAKAMLCRLLKEFRLERSEKTCESLLDDIRGFTIEPKSGFWLKLVKRSETTEM